MHQDTFNADFYVVAATVIPVLYLALTLQGSTYERILAGWQANTLRKTKHGRSEFSNFFYALFAVIGSIIVLGGFLGESAAISALYSRSPAGGAGIVVLVSLIALLVIAAGGPAVRFWALAFKLAFWQPEKNEETEGVS